MLFARPWGARVSASAVNAIVNSAAYADGRRVADVRIDEIGATLCQPDRFVWIGLHEPDEELLKQVQQEFGLHDLAIEDAHRAHQRPKLERYGECIFVATPCASCSARRWRPPSRSSRSRRTSR
ncbi:MAG: CorA family divalent cation transporter [Armatimonadota bacterium]